VKQLLAIVVNHRSGAFCARCIQSLRRVWALEGRDACDLEVLVVDTASGPEEESWLSAIEAEGTEVVRSEENLGYAGGMIVGYRQALKGESAQGTGHEAVALLNPDLHFTAGSIAPLLEELERDPGCGAVGPRMSVDEHGALHHPRLDLPLVADEVAALQARFDPSSLRVRLARRARSAAAFYKSEGPRVVPMLSGACVVMRRETVEALGSPLDGAYPLYYEDAQLAQDLRNLGLNSKVVPTSHVLHHWSRSAGCGEEFAGEPARRAAFGRELFHGRHGDARQSAALKEVEALLARADVAPPFSIEDLGVVEEPPSVAFEPFDEVLIEVSACPFFPLAAGVVTFGGEWHLDDSLWGWLFPGRWYVRAACARTGRHLGAWEFEKTQAARTEPVALGGTDGQARSLEEDLESRRAA